MQRMFALDVIISQVRDLAWRAGSGAAASAQQWD